MLTPYIALIDWITSLALTLFFLPSSSFTNIVVLALNIGVVYRLTIYATHKLIKHEMTNQCQLINPITKYCLMSAILSSFC